MEKSTIQFHRKPQVLDRAGFGTTTLYNRIKEGLFPPPVPLGPRAVGWVESEYSQVLAFMIVEKSEEEIKALVSRLVEQRKSIAEEPNV